MFDEDILVPLIVFTFLFMTIRMFLMHRKETVARKLEAKVSATEGGSLRTSELKALIREAVEEANEPLLERVEAVERRLEASPHPRLLPADAKWLEALEGEDPARVKALPRP